MVVHKNIFKSKVEQKHSLTALDSGFTDKIFSNFENPLNNTFFSFNICLSLANFTHKIYINVFATQNMWSKFDNVGPA